MADVCEQSVAIDPALFMSAESIFEVPEKWENRALLSLETIANHYCNDAKLIVPLPGNEIGQVPLFLRLWDSSELSYIGRLEYDEDINTNEMLVVFGDRVLSYLNTSADSVATFIAHQFSEAMVEQHLSRGIGLEDIERVAGFTNLAIGQNRLDKLIASFDAAKRNGILRRPARYQAFVGISTIPTFNHLCCGYAIAACLRGKKFAEGIGVNHPSSTYEHHWVRAPVLRQGVSSDEIRERQEKSYPKWGALLVNAVKTNTISRDYNEIADFLNKLKENAPNDILELDARERNEALIDLVTNLGIAPPKSSSRFRNVTESFVKNADESGLFASTILEVVDTFIPHRQLRKAESNLHARYLRSTFWDKYDINFFRGVVPSVEESAASD